MKQLPTLEELIEVIDRDDRDPLELLTDAVILSGNLGDLADEVVDHFVQRSREDGASWAEIGQSMGVSKQAAQKRFVTEGRSRVRLSKGGLFTRFDASGRSAVQKAVGHAHKLRSVEINTLHLVMGLADPESGRARQAISDLAASADEVVAEAKNAVTGSKRTRKVKHLPFASDAKKVLELSLREAIRAESRRIGSEFILLGLLRDQSDGARLLDQHGVSRSSVEQWLVDNPVDDL